MKRRRKNSIKTLKHIKKHFCQRLYIRFGIQCNDEMYKEITKSVQGIGVYKCEKVFFESNAKVHYDIELFDKKVRIVYNKKLGGACTALYPDEETGL